MRRATIGCILLAMAMVGCASTEPIIGNPPVLQKVVMREEVGRFDHIFPTFFFQADGGDVVSIHRQIISSDVQHQNFNPVSRIDIAADQQKSGAVWVGGWGCGPDHSTTTVRAYLQDRRGNHSNSLDYTVVCKGAAELPVSPSKPN